MLVASVPHEEQAFLVGQAEDFPPPLAHDLVVFVIEIHCSWEKERQAGGCARDVSDRLHCKALFYKSETPLCLGSKCEFLASPGWTIWNARLTCIRTDHFHPSTATAVLFERDD